MKKDSGSSKIANISLCIFLGILAYVPLHIFLSTWIGTSFGVLSFAKIFKDILLIIGFMMISAVSLRQGWIFSFIKRRIIYIIAGYAALTLLMAAIKPSHQESEMLAILYNLRFLLFFIYGGLLTRFYDAKWLIGLSSKTVLIVAVPVLILGLLQYTILPDDILGRFGYSRENGVLPAFHIDNKPDLERITSTLREPNVYGSYLLIIISMALALVLKKANPMIRNVGLGFLILSVLNLYFTFSRSAWIGGILSILLFGYFSILKGVNKQVVLRILIVMGILFTLSLGGLFIARDTYFVKNVILHADENTVLEDPNELRLRFFRESIESSVSNPIGYGPGTAGLASIRNDEQGVILNENYYLQIAHEVGIVGLGVFIFILVIVFNSLWAHINDDWMGLALVASLVGLSFTNLLVHIWSSESVAYTWWGLAGLVVFSNIEQLDKVKLKKGSNKSR